MNATRAERTASALILTGLFAIVTAAGVAWATSQEPPASGFVWKDGAEVYAKVCAFCHEAKVGPTIRGRGLDPAYIRFVVRHGNRAMPAFRTAEIDDESLAEVAEYVSK
ncbi:MAG: c-type cytochrome [Nitrospirae bacterium]|nr:c-type cytochrome [Nitrospirota bacterium]